MRNVPRQQLVYYQPGIGTSSKQQFVTGTAAISAMAVDQSVALNINDHIKDGYRYVVQNYRKGDKISIFGFSRGAHTARVVAGMLYKVGILRPHSNDAQLDLALHVYQKTGDEGYNETKAFRKQHLVLPVTIEFVGVWDTVSSVGIIPRSHPYTSVNYAVKHFRHALALDERRARFTPNFWNEPTLEPEQELDIDDPDVEFPPQPMGTLRDGWVYTPPSRDVCDVQEVWFSGTHADVGGGSHSNKEQASLSYIPLRWMIKECLFAGTGILFDPQYLVSFGINLRNLAAGLREKGFSDSDLAALNFSQDVLRRTQDNRPDISHAPQAQADVSAKIYDQLSLGKGWWILELLPTTFGTYQRFDGAWVRKRMSNFGQGRYIPFHEDEDEIKVHISVKLRMDDPKQRYIPAAYNWDVALKSGMLTWVGKEEDERDEKVRTNRMVDANS
ncbi:hypothetical protein FPV67DRAFT_1500640 [Lyophyllum atratum]|nr:hypothetical protein FPV67DRAFT_1500640 [Lyophyllum atratum]